MALIKCSSCGKEIDDNSKFCRYCCNPVDFINDGDTGIVKSYNQLTKRDKKTLNFNRNFYKQESKFINIFGYICLTIFVILLFFTKGYKIFVSFGIPLFIILIIVACIDQKKYYNSHPYIIKRTIEYKRALHKYTEKQQYEKLKKAGPYLFLGSTFFVLGMLFLVIGFQLFACKIISFFLFAIGVSFFVYAGNKYLK